MKGYDKIISKTGEHLHEDVMFMAKKKKNLSLSFFLLYKKNWNGEFTKWKFTMVQWRSGQPGVHDISLDLNCTSLLINAFRLNQKLRTGALF